MVVAATCFKGEGTTERTAAVLEGRLACAALSLCVFQASNIKLGLPHFPTFHLEIAVYAVQNSAASCTLVQPLPKALHVS